jgi:hypothetical protein
MMRMIYKFYAFLFIIYSFVVYVVSDPENRPSQRRTSDPETGFLTPLKDLKTQISNLVFKLTF